MNTSNNREGEIDENIISAIEAVIFNEGGEVTIKFLIDIFSISISELNNVVSRYNDQVGGLRMIADTEQIVLYPAKEYTPLFKKKLNGRKQLSKAALEVLAIVLYSGSSSVTAAEIEYIRGTNSKYVLRQLMLRGLLNKVRQGLGYKYSSTTDLLAFLGVSRNDMLPEYESIVVKLVKFRATQANEDVDECE